MAGKGILKIVSFGGRPAEVREEIIRELRSHLTEGQILDITSALKEGILVQMAYPRTCTWVTNSTVLKIQKVMQGSQRWSTL